MKYEALKAVPYAAVDFFRVVLRREYSVGTTGLANA
jgi:hypothetical protein